MKPLLTIFLVTIFAVVFCKNIQIGRQRRQVRYCQDRCILLRRCKSFLVMIRNNLLKAVSTVWRSRCGREQLKLKVCCPDPSPNTVSYFPSTCGINPIVSGHIFNGERTEMGEFPWMAALGYKDTENSDVVFKCSGSIINERYVLTAAHCIYSTNPVVVRLGEWDLSKKIDCFETYNGGQKCAPSHIDLQGVRFIPHLRYNDNGDYENDIGLIRLNQTIDFKTKRGYILPICLPPFGFNARFWASNQELTVAGWGMTENEMTSDVLLKTELSFANNSLCYRYYGSAFGYKKLCVGGTEKDSCQGDSGGPLMLAGPLGPPYLQVGIVSFGTICQTFGPPAVYTSVSDYMDWITSNLEPW